MNKLLVILLFSPIISFGQTTIITALEKDSIVLSADSKIVITKNVKVNSTKYISKRIEDTALKIGGYGNVFFGVAGLETQALALICEKICKNQKSMNDAGRKYIDIATPHLRNTLLVMKKADPLRYKASLGQPVAGALLCGFLDNGEACIVSLNFIPKLFGKSKELGFSLDSKYYCYEEFRDTAIIMGHDEAIKNIVKVKKTWQGDKVKVSVQLIKKQEKKTPRDVGSPIDVVVIKKDGSILKRYD